VRVWAYGRPVDLRKGYNGLVGLVENELRSDPMGGELYLFVNAKRTGGKVLLWDGTGRFADLWSDGSGGNKRLPDPASVRSFYPM